VHARVSPGRTTETCWSARTSSSAARSWWPWDNLNTHLAAGLKRYEAEHDWLTTVRLPPYAPDLNPVEAVWSLVRRAMANTAFDTSDDLDRILRRELRKIQLRPHLVDGCLTVTGLAITPPTPP
jgi:putative transposase